MRWRSRWRALENIIRTLITSARQRRDANATKHRRYTICARIITISENNNQLTSKKFGVPVSFLINEKEWIEMIRDWIWILYILWVKYDTRLNKSSRLASALSAPTDWGISCWRMQTELIRAPALFNELNLQKSRQKDRVFTLIEVCQRAAGPAGPNGGPFVVTRSASSCAG